MRDVHLPVLEGYKGKSVGVAIDMLTVAVRRDIDLEYLQRAEAFIRKNAARSQPFYVYFNHSMMHMPVVPRQQFAGRSESGDWADSLLELDADFGQLLDLIDELGVAEETIVILAGDNGAEDTSPWRGTSGYWQGSYFTGMEGSLRSPCLIRWPGYVPANRRSNEIVHITDMFTTLVRWAGAEVPQDRVIDGADRRAFFEAQTTRSARDGFIFWNGPRICGVKWRDFKIAMVQQQYFWDPVLEYAVPHIYNLKQDTKKRENQAVYYGWVASHAGRMIGEFTASIKREPPIPSGAPVGFNPYPAKAGT